MIIAGKTSVSHDTRRVPGVHNEHACWLSRWNTQSSPPAELLDRCIFVAATRVDVSWGPLGPVEGAQLAMRSRIDGKSWLLRSTIDLH